jgi:hypothetical protein
MQAILKFNLDDENDKNEYEQMMQASDMHCVIWDILQQLRNWRKYDEREQIPKEELDEKLLPLITSRELKGL